jgi:hypothetical protein
MFRQPFRLTLAVIARCCGAMLCGPTPSQRNAKGWAREPERTGAYLPVLTKLTQSPWFLNVRGTLKVCQPPFLH